MKVDRWIPIKATTPSGKSLFVCTYCGVVGPTPDKECYEEDGTITQCSAREEEQLLKLFEPVLLALILTSENHVDRVKELSRDEAIAYVRDERDNIFTMIEEMQRSLPNYERYMVVSLFRNMLLSRE